MWNFQNDVRKVVVTYDGVLETTTTYYKDGRQEVKHDFMLDEYVPIF